LFLVAAAALPIDQTIQVDSFQPSILRKPTPPIAVTNSTFNVLMNGATGVLEFKYGGNATLYWDSPYMFPIPGATVTTVAQLSNVGWTYAFNKAWVVTFTFHLAVGIPSVSYPVSASLLVGFVKGLNYYDLNGQFTLSGKSSPYPFTAILASGSLANYQAPNWHTSVLSNGWAGELNLNFATKSEHLIMDNAALPNGNSAPSELASNEVITLKHPQSGEYFTWDRPNGQKYIALTHQTGASAYGQFTDAGWPDRNGIGGILAPWTFHLTLGTYAEKNVGDLKCALLGTYVLLYGFTTLQLTLYYSGNPLTPGYYPCGGSPSQENPSGGVVKATLMNTANVQEDVLIKTSNRHWGWYMYFESVTVSPGKYDALFDNYFNPHGFHGHVIASGISYPLHGAGPLP